MCPVSSLIICETLYRIVPSANKSCKLVSGSSFSSNTASSHSLALSCRNSTSDSRNEALEDNAPGVVGPSISFLLASFCVCPGTYSADQELYTRLATQSICICLLQSILYIRQYCHLQSAHYVDSHLSRYATSQAIQGVPGYRKELI
jgi:hypothetical protein